MWLLSLEELQLTCAVAEGAAEKSLKLLTLPILAALSLSLEIKRQLLLHEHAIAVENAVEDKRLLQLKCTQRCR